MLADETTELLKDARRSFTRQRICAAARAVFAEQGLDGATMEQIAQAAGTRRSTVYNHFRDKQEILAEIAREFGGRTVEMIDRLPEGRPSRAELQAWVREIGAFAVRERAPTILLLQLGMAFEAPEQVHDFGARMMRAMAERLPAFRRALEPGAEQGLIQARALVVLREIGFACAAQLRGDDPATVQNMMTVAGELLERFIEDHS